MALQKVRHLGRRQNKFQNLYLNHSDERAIAKVHGKSKSVAPSSFPGMEQLPLLLEIGAHYIRRSVNFGIKVMRIIVGILQNQEATRNALSYRSPRDFTGLLSLIPVPVKNKPSSKQDPIGISIPAYQAPGSIGKEHRM